MTKKKTKPTNVIGQFGEQFKEFKHKPKAAIIHLKKIKRGECIAALNRADIGDIDIVWGEVTEPTKHKGYGLAHIIDKHGAEIKGLGFEVEDFIPIVVQFGEFNNVKSDSQKKVYESELFRFVIAMQTNGKGNKAWLLTAFDLRKKPKKKSLAKNRKY